MHGLVKWFICLMIILFTQQGSSSETEGSYGRPRSNAFSLPNDTPKRQNQGIGVNNPQPSSKLQNQNPQPISRPLPTPVIRPQTPSTPPRYSPPPIPQPSLNSNQLESKIEEKSQFPSDSLGPIQQPNLPQGSMKPTSPNLSKPPLSQVPSIEEMRDPSKPWGLNLAKVKERGAKLRTKNKEGGGNDISNYPGLYASGPLKKNEAQQNIVAITSQMNTIISKITPEQIDQLNQKSGRFSKAPDNRALAETLSEVIRLSSQLKEAIAKYDRINSLLEITRNKLKKDLGLTESQIDSIPPLSTWDSIK